MVWGTWMGFGGGVAYEVVDSYSIEFSCIMLEVYR